MSLVSDVFDTNPRIAAFSDCTNVQVAKPTTDFLVRPHSEYCKWGAPNPRVSCTMHETATPYQAALYGFDPKTTAWSSNCWNLTCQPR